ncbi:MAG TPA: IS982 family transposase, partial [Pyrinomonadaceae bacterium]|nr:IS982 family transposase [Pyrinomonadaceae bacterium]
SRKGNSKRGDGVWRGHYRQLMRKRIETVFSRIASLFPKHIHAVTLDGFVLKASLFVIAFALDKASI